MNLELEKLKEINFLFRVSVIQCFRGKVSVVDFEEAVIWMD